MTSSQVNVKVITISELPSALQCSYRDSSDTILDVPLLPAQLLSYSQSLEYEDTQTAQTFSVSVTRLSPLHSRVEDVQYFSESGALRDGAPPSLCSIEMLGIFAQYAGVGLLYASLPGMIYPLLQNYFNVEGMQTLTARSLLALPWACKIVYGIFIDCIPICGLRRRPYMIMGWCISLCMLLAMALIPLGKPYFTDPSLRFIKPQEYTVEDVYTINYRAKYNEVKYTAMMMVATFGYLLSDVAADAVVVEYAQREPEDARGRIQSAVYTTRNVFMMLANLFNGLLLNGTEYGGDFSSTFTFPQIICCYAVCIALILLITFFCVYEDVVPHTPISLYLVNLWNQMQNQILHQIVLYKFVSSFLENVTSVALDPMQQYYARVTPIAEKLANVMSMALMASTCAYMGQYGRHWNWRTATIISILSMTMLEALAGYLTTWDIVRNQWFWLLMPVLETVPRGVTFIVSMYLAVELVTVGYEGAMYGLLTTVTNLGDIFAKAVSKGMNAPLDLDNLTIQNDSAHVRWQVTVSISIVYIAKLCSLLWLPLLPRQKHETQVLRGISMEKSHAMALYMVIALMIAFLYTIIANVLSVIPFTQCTMIAGGDGCGA